MNKLEKLIYNNHKVSIDNGRMMIDFKSGQPVDPKWLKKHREDLILEILQATGVNAYQFMDHATGVTKGHNHARLTLNFVNVLTGKLACVHYNCDISRSRATKKHKKGNPLPKGRFNVGERSKFVELWKSLGLQMPRSLSEFPDIINRLKPLLFECDVKSVNGYDHFDDKVMPLCSISYHTICEAVFRKNSVKNSVNVREEVGWNSREGHPGSPGMTQDSANGNYVSHSVRIKSSQQGVTYPYPEYLN
jgi:hypothetical protein